VRARCWAQAGQSRPYRVLGATLAPVAAERMVPRFRYQYLHRVLPHQERQAGGTVSARFSAVDSAYCAGAVSAATRSWP
jgi:hypothetical protein